MATSCSADWASPPVFFSLVCVHVANTVGPLPNGEPPVRGRRRNSSETAHSPGAGLLDRDILDGGLAGSVVQHHLAAEQLGDHAHLAAALLEAAQVDEAGGDDLAGADARDATDREEDAALARDLDDQADHGGRLRVAVDDEHVAHLADLVAGGVENGAPGQSGDEDSRGAHA